MTAKYLMITGFDGRPSMAAAFAEVGITGEGRRGKQEEKRRESHARRRFGS
jgi:hypothetical protein